MTVLKPGSLLVTGGSVGDTAPGLEVTYNPNAPAGQSAVALLDYLNAPIFTFGPAAGQSYVYGDLIRAFPTLGAAIAAAGVGFDGTRNPAALMFPDGTSAAGFRVWYGTGAPSSTTIGGAAARGDVYIRRDRGTGTTVYRCAVAGTPGTWVASAL